MTTEIIPKCCTIRELRWKITYKCGPNGRETILLCDYHKSLGAVMLEHIETLEELT